MAERQGEVPMVRLDSRFSGVSLRPSSMTGARGRLVWLYFRYERDRQMFDS
jgi:hypothetical protein